MIKFTDEELEYIGYAIDNFEPFNYDDIAECEIYSEIQRKISNYFVFRKIDEETYKESFWTYCYADEEIEEDIKFYSMYILKETVRKEDEKYEKIYENFKGHLKRNTPKWRVENPVFTYWELEE